MRLRHAIVLSLWLLNSSVTAQITIQVELKDINRPLAKAMVRVKTPAGRAIEPPGLTDAKGEFRAKALPGNYKLIHIYVDPAEDDLKAEAFLVDIQRPENKAAIRIKISPSKIR